MLSINYSELHSWTYFLNKLVIYIPNKWYISLMCGQSLWMMVYVSNVERKLAISDYKKRILYNCGMQLIKNTKFHMWFFILFKSFQNRRSLMCMPWLPSLCHLWIMLNENRHKIRTLKVFGMENLHVLSQDLCSLPSWMHPQKDRYKAGHVKQNPSHAT
jgi:hypothetical protein